MNKVLVKLFVPSIEAKYEVWIPVNKQVFEVINILVKSVNELSGGYYIPSKTPMLFDKITSKQYDINLNVKDNGIINGSEVILI